MYQTLLEETLSEMGANLWIDPVYGDIGEIVFANHHKTLFRNTVLALNSYASADIAKDKGYTLMLLERAGLPTVRGETLLRSDYARHISHAWSPDMVESYIREYGYPLIIKPNTASLGSGVYKVYSITEVWKYIERLFQMTPMIRLERYHVGRDYRVVVLDGRVRIAYERSPMRVIGDGSGSVGELFEERKISLVRQGREICIQATDDRITHRLSCIGYTLETIPKKDEVVTLLDNANLSTGGESHDITEEIHPDFVHLAQEAAQTLGLRLAGVDMLADDLTLPLDQNKHVAIIELNGAPGLDNYMSSGETQRERVKDLYRDILRALEAC